MCPFNDFCVHNIADGCTCGYDECDGTACIDYEPFDKEVLRN